ncbi:MAG: S8 family serine peptidase [Pseudomonadota bacterium]
MRPVLFLALLACVLTACARPAAVGRAANLADFKLSPANQIADARHLIVTIALAEPDQVAGTAAALEEEHAVTMVAEWPLRSINVHCFVLRIEPGATAEAVAEALAADPRVRTVQPMQRFSTLSASASQDLSAMQDALAILRVRAAHTAATGQGVRIAVIDTGIDRNHPDLARRISVARDFVGDGGADRAEEHGTAVAGVIAADADDGRGIIGVAPDAEILALRACWQEPDGPRGQCSSFTIARALDFALRNDVDVLNLSLGGPYDALLAEILAVALERGVPVIAATGEAGVVAFPASKAGVVAVAALSDQNNGPASEQDTAFLAPGRDVLSTAPNEEYDFYSGSSIAAAHVSGLVALLLDVRPDLTVAQVRTALGSRNRHPAKRGRPDACSALSIVGETRQLLACGPDRVGY